MNFKFVSSRCCSYVGKPEHFHLTNGWCYRIRGYERPLNATGNKYVVVKQLSYMKKMVHVRAIILKNSVTKLHNLLMLILSIVEGIMVSKSA